MRKIAYCGTHGTGKTSSVYRAAHEFQIQGYETCILAESALECPLEIDNRATPESQLWIFSKQITSEVSVSPRYDCLICDRTVMDSIAYSHALGFIDLAEACFPLAAHHMSTYETVILNSLDKNNFEGEPTDFRKDVERLLMLYLDRALTYGADFKLVID